MKILKDKVAFITGGASGIGLAMASAFLAEGMKVALADRDIERLESVVKEFGDKALAIPLDVTDRNQWQAAKSSVLSHFGRVDVLCNNAGIGPDGKDLADVNPDSFDKIIGINLTGVYNGINAFAAYLRQRECGHIVNTASMAGITSNPKLGPYTTSKFAIVGMTEVLRKELAPFGIGVTVFCPGLVKTRLAANAREGGADEDNADMSSGMAPAVAVRAVVSAIKENKLYAISHKERKPSVKVRVDELLAAFK